MYSAGLGKRCSLNSSGGPCRFFKSYFVILGSFSFDKTTPMKQETKINNTFFIFLQINQNQPVTNQIRSMTEFDQFMIKFEEKAKEFFKVADLNGDGEITKKEWKKCEKVYAEAKHQNLTSFEKEEKMKEFKLLDIDGNGSLTQEEFVGGSKKLMEQMREICEKNPQSIKSFGNYILNQMDEQMKIIKKEKEAK